MAGSLIKFSRRIKAILGNKRRIDFGLGQCHAAALSDLPPPDLPQRLMMPRRQCCHRDDRLPAMIAHGAVSIRR